MHAHNSKQCIFLSYSTSAFNATRFDENPFSCWCEKEDKKAEGFRHFYLSFSNDIMAMKGSEGVKHYAY